MSKVLVVYYSAFGYVAIVANAITDGTRIVVGPPYSATTIADATGQRHPSALDLECARQQGRLIAQTAERLSGRGASGAAALEPSAALEAATT